MQNQLRIDPMSYARVPSIASRPVVARLRTAYAVAGCLTLFVGLPVQGAQPRVRYERTSAAEVVPAPLSSTAQANEPLAKLITDAEYRSQFRAIGQVGVDVRPRNIRQGKAAGDMPPNAAARVLAEQSQPCCGNCRREWPCQCFRWEASALCHQPLYFEETNLERYGYSPRGLRLIQPVLSAANFFLTIPLLPYKMGAEPPHQGVYTLGQYRPGSPVPYRIGRPRLSLVGIVAEAGIIAGLIVLIP